MPHAEINNSLFKIAPGIIACFVIFSIFHSQATAMKTKDLINKVQIYIVRMEGTSIVDFRKNRQNQVTEADHLGNLARKRSDLLDKIKQVLNRKVIVLHIYEAIFHGVTLELSTQEVKKLKRFPEIINIQLDVKQRLHINK